MQGLFRRFADWASEVTGTVWAFAAATLVVLIWAVSGPVFGFSDTWQLIINTGTTVVTFLMVFLIQTTQNRDNTALHAKLDELIVHTQGAHNELAAAENFTDEQLKEIKEHFRRLSDQGGTKAGGRLNVANGGNGKPKGSTGRTSRTNARGARNATKTGSGTGAR